MSTKISVTTLKNKIEVNGETKVVSVITQGSQGAKGLELDESNRVDGSILRFRSSDQKYVADSTVTPLALTDGGNF